MNDYKKYIPLLLGIAAAFGVLLGSQLHFYDDSDKLFISDSKKDKINRLIDYIDYEYVEDVNTDSIVDVTVNGILENLDPHTTYIPQSEMQRVRENMEGSFVGIGIEFHRYQDTITVIRTTPNGPSARAGIKAGDRIIMANKDSIYGRDFDNDSLIGKLKGKLYSTVNLKIYRKTKDTLLDIKIKRNKIPLKSIDAFYKISPEVGYIKINRFAESTYKEFKVALESLIAQGITKLAVDLRNNPGGYLGVTEQIVDEFLEKNKLILFTKNKRGKVEEKFATSRGLFENGELFILINENSASASEVIAGALQDHDKATIIGRRSYGKGLVQREMSLGDGSAVRLTVSKYYTPTGRSIQKPYDKGNQSYFDDYIKRKRNGELVNPDKILVVDSLKFKTPKGKVVYGGGGIIPDVFVPVDDFHHSETMNYLERKGYFRYFAFKTIDDNREVYNQINVDDFLNQYEITDSIFSQLRQSINATENTNLTFNKYKTQMSKLLKSAMAEQLFNDTTAYQIKYQDDHMIQEVLQLSKPLDSSLVN